MKRIISILLTAALILSAATAVSGAAGPALAAETDQTALETMRDVIKSAQETDTAASSLPAADEIVELIVELHAATATELSVDQTAEEAAQNVEIMKRVEEAQDACIQKILAIDPDAEITQRYGLLVNGFSLKTLYGNKSEIEALPEVSSVILANTYTRSTASAQQYSGISQVWKDYGYDGRGIVVAVIDSGIDYNHKDMVISDGIPVKLGKDHVEGIIGAFSQPHGQYFTDKVPFGYNYADKNNDIIDRAVDDPAYNHGMHVAGIIGANCQSEEELVSYNGVRGVAPECQLLAMKIFSNNPAITSSSEADIIAAIEDSVALGADVINLSIGLSAGFHNPENGQQKAIKAARDAGVIVVAASGNGATSDYLQASGGQTGENYDTLVDIGTIAEPGLADDAIQVASTDNIRRIVWQLSAWSGSDERISLPYILSDFHTSNLTGRYQVVYCGLGRLEDLAGKDLTGKIALVERGAIEFQEKKLNVQEHGAVAAIIYNSKGEENFLDYISTSEEVKIPTVFMRYSDGNTLRQLCEAGLEVSFDQTLMEIEQPGGGISYFSSWGPNSDLTFKPDLTAVGGYVWSTIGNNGYQTMSGTSMACPNVSGMAALILQHIKQTGIVVEDTTSYVKAALMNTAEILIDSEGMPLSPRAQGAGLALLHKALENHVTATCEGEPFIELQVINIPRTVSVELYNSGDDAVTYVPTALGSSADCVTFSSDCVTIVPGKAVSLEVTFTPDRSHPTNTFFEGFIRFIPSEASLPEIGLPFMGFNGDWASLQIMDDPMYEGRSVHGATSLYTSINYGHITQTVPLGDGLYPEYFAINPSDPDSYCNVMPQVSFLRNARDVTVDVTDNTGEVLKVISQEDYVRKEVPIEQSILAEVNFNWLWTGTYYDKLSGQQQAVTEGQYYINVRARADYENAEEQVLTMPIKIDATAPTVGVRTSFTQSEICQLEITAKDLGVVDGGISSFVFLVDGQPYVDANGNSVFDLPIDADGKYHMELPIPDAVQGDIHTVDIGVTDYANNMGAARAQVIDTSNSQLTVNVEKADFAPGEPVEVKFYWVDGADTGSATEYRVYIDTLQNMVGSTAETSFIISDLLNAGMYTVIIQALDSNGQVIDMNYAEFSISGSETPGQTLSIRHMTGSQVIQNGESFIAEIEAANLGAAPERIALIICLYDTQQRLVDTVAVEREVAPGTVERMSGLLMIPASGQYRVKIMVWDGLDTMESLLPHRIIEMQ